MDTWRSRRTTGGRLRGVLVRTTRSHRVRQWMVVMTTVVVLELIVFGGYFAGVAIPAADSFIGPANNEPAAWWRDALTAGPPSWFPYIWGGYPVAASLQSGEWYLPVGLVSLVTPYTIHAASVLQALTVGFGALGAHVLGRVWRLRFLASLLGLVTFFAAVGTYAHTGDPAIVRGLAFAPWVLLCISPAFPWRRLWAPAVTALVLWQAIEATTVGVTMAMSLCCAAAVVSFQLTGRPSLRQYLLPLSVALLGTVLLCVPAYATSVELVGATPAADSKVSRLATDWVSALAGLGSITGFPDGAAVLSLLVVAPCWAVFALAHRRDGRLLAPVVALSTTAGALTVPWWPWWGTSDRAPGAPFGALRLIELQVPLFLAFLVAAMVMFSSSLATPEVPGRREQAARLVMLSAITGGALVVARSAHLPVRSWWTATAVIVGSAALTAIAGHIVGMRGADAQRLRQGATLGVVALVTVTGATWGAETTGPWRHNRASQEVIAWGATSGQLDTTRTSTEGARRPARVPLDDQAASPNDVRWNSGFYTGADAVGGAVGHFSSPAYRAALAATTSTDPATYLASRSILAAPGLAVALRDHDDLPTQQRTEQCAAQGACGPGLRVTPISYTAGRLAYRLDADGPRTVLFNEAYYPGWQIEACRPGTRYCRDLPVTMGGAGLVVTQLPVGGAWNVTLTYTSPGQTRGTAAAAFALAVVLLPGAWRLRRRTALLRVS